MPFCTSCGEQLPDNAAFCHRCGTRVEHSCGSSPYNVNSASNPYNPYASVPPVRREEYVGVVYKCPNCGNTINPTETICPACGYHLSRSNPDYTVKQFSLDLMALQQRKSQENARRGPLGAVAKGFSDAFRIGTDDDTALFIQSFPIPNSVEEILAFVVLAASNIDVTLSKKSVINRANAHYKSEDQKASDAWVSKMEQAYRMAEISFPDDDLFPKIKSIYEQKMKELKRLKRH